MTASAIALTFMGGALGTAARFAVSAELGNSLLTLSIVNLLGAAALGFFNTHPKFNSDALRAFWGVGFAGGFTTMSGVALIFLGELEQPVFITVAVLLMFWLGVLSYRLGLRLGRRSGASS